MPCSSNASFLIIFSSVKNTDALKAFDLYYISEPLHVCIFFLLKNLICLKITTEKCNTAILTCAGGIHMDRITYKPETMINLLIFRFKIAMVFMSPMAN